jgi:cobalt-zinc-cadmium efflux system outer membrane protein
MRAARRTIAGGLLLVLGGCASVDPTPDYGRAQDEVTAATGAKALYQPGEEARAREQVAELLEGGLTPQEAVQVALLNNRGLQELLFEIGVRRADAVQSGLLSNPSLQTVLRLPVDGGSTGAEGGILQNLIDIWHLPVRKRLAEGQVERTVLDVAQHAVAVAAQAKAAYFTALASSATLSVAEENLKTAQDFLELTLERQDAGAATQVDVNAARSTFLEQQVLVRSARFSAFDSKRRFVLILGLAAPPEEVSLADELVAPPDKVLDIQRLLAVAREHRLDLRSAEKSVEVTGNVIPLERRRMWRSVKGGVGFESEGSDLALGPAINLELPIFDQNQAQVAKAEFRYAQALRRLEGVSAHVDQQVRGAYEHYAMAQDTARLYRTELLPLRETGLDLARESFAAGKTGFLSVLEAQDRLLATRREYVERLEAVALSIPDLEAACGRPLDVLLGSDE